MRVILIAIGSADDIFPFIGLANALNLRGHRATLCSLPAFKATLEQYGLEFEPLCQEGTDEPPRLHGSKTALAMQWNAASHLLEPTYDYLAARRHEDIVVVGSFWALGARVAQERFCIAYLSVQISPFLRETHRLMLDRLCAPQLNAFRARKGLGGTVQHVVSQWMHSPDGVISLCPEWFAPQQAAAPATLCKACEKAVAAIEHCHQRTKGRLTGHSKGAINRDSPD
ncbi:rhamnosyltransferase subunit B [Pseudomonas sp. GGS8]|uniref:glycosyltransferase n=1 Tax=Pseudomonas sp. GGS8 TaxID=2817892 RepID=UPI0020A1EF59|nr:glycosyltransferase [Pseudomonas sp. GGS8]MCP1445873.1 rhamnosyltransferase subunit B [Pseudomonas sp. GGS8]